jgi:hypothetical protein
MYQIGTNTNNIKVYKKINTKQIKPRKLIFIEKYLLNLIIKYPILKSAKDIWSHIKYLLINNGVDEFGIFYSIESEEQNLLFNAKSKKITYTEFDDMIYNIINDITFDIKKIKLESMTIEEKKEYSNIIINVYRNVIVFNNNTWLIYKPEENGWERLGDSEFSYYVFYKLYNELIITYDVNTLITSRSLTLYKTMFVNENFHMYFDLNYLVRFNNGVYDLRTNNFRQGYPSDFCCKSIGRDYDENLSYDKLIPMLKTLFIDNDIYSFSMCYMASFFEPNNKDKIFMIMRGNGDNGKTWLGTLLCKVMGNYLNRPDISQLCSRRSSSSAASPDWITNDRARVIMYLEVSENTKIDDGLLKSITGGEHSLKARALYADERDIKIIGKIIVTTNMSWNMGVMESALLRRICVWPFLTKFTEKPNYANNERLLDKNLNTDDFVSSLTTYLLKEWYSVYSKGLVIPFIVTTYTNEFVYSGDSVAAYMTSNYTKIKGYKIIYDSVYSGYKIWFKQRNTSTCLNSNQFKSILREKGYIFLKDVILDLKVSEDSPSEDGTLIEF